MLAVVPPPWMGPEILNSFDALSVASAHFGADVLAHGGKSVFRRGAHSRFSIPLLRCEVISRAKFAAGTESSSCIRHLLTFTICVSRG